MTVGSSSLSKLLQDLTESLESASANLSESADHFIPPQDGISLLDVKNDLLLSYLQNLAFLILFKIRNCASKETNADNGLYTPVVERLLELRVYLERGVRPIEQRLKYTIDQYLQAAQHKKTVQTTRTSTGHIRNADASDISDSDASDNNDAPTGLNTATTSDETVHAPRLNTLSLTASKPQSTSQAHKTNTSNNTGIYRPPRHNPTSMPSSDPDARSSQPRQRKSQLLNEYIDEELSSAPTAHPSIGSNHTIGARGHGLSTRDVAKERERTEYEETNFTRLPGESKKEKREKKRREGREGQRDMFGGEDWTGLGGLGDRIGRSVDAKTGLRDGVLKRREKRRATEDSVRGDGLQVGDSFEKRRKVLAGRAERKGGRRK